MKHILKNKKILVPIVVALLGFAGISVTQKQANDVLSLVVPDEAQQTVQEEFNDASLISPQRRTHILYGDQSGGGHLYGTGKPCKSEFPKNWDKEDVIENVTLIAANDNLSWEKQRNGYHVTEKDVNGVTVRVVKGREGKKVITAYPLNTGRNPCGKD